MEFLQKDYSLKVTWVLKTDDFLAKLEPAFKEMTWTVNLDPEDVYEHFQ